MKRRKKYTMSDKRKLRDAKKANWSKRMEVVRLVEERLAEGINFTNSAQLVADIYKQSRQSIEKMYKSAKKVIST